MSATCGFIVLRIEAGPNLVPPFAGDRLMRHAFRQSQRAVAPGLRVFRREWDSSSSSSSPRLNDDSWSRGFGKIAVQDFRLCSRMYPTQCCVPEASTTSTCSPMDLRGGASSNGNLASIRRATCLSRDSSCSETGCRATNRGSARRVTGTKSRSSRTDKIWPSGLEFANRCTAATRNPEDDQLHGQSLIRARCY